MVAPRFRKQTLLVIAVPQANVREIDEQGRPLMMMRFVGKDTELNIIQFGVEVPYHPHYISQLKDKTLLPADRQTAQLAGVPFVYAQ